MMQRRIIDITDGSGWNSLSVLLADRLYLIGTKGSIVVGIVAFLQSVQISVFHEVLSVVRLKNVSWYVVVAK